METDTAALAASIGTRVKQHRRSHGWTLDQLSQSAGVSRRMLVNVEKGSVNPSVGTLLRLSDALGVGLPALVEPLTSQAVTVTRHGEGAVLWTSETGGRGVLVAGTAPPNVVELWDWTLGAGDRYASEAHSRGTKELVQVREGSLTIDVDGLETTLEVGDAASFPGDAAHSYVNPGSAPTRFALSVFEPGVGGHRQAAVHA